jgi:hypothetical protein
MLPALPKKSNRSPEDLRASVVFGLWNFDIEKSLRHCRRSQPTSGLAMSNDTTHALLVAAAGVAAVAVLIIGVFAVAQVLYCLHVWLGTAAALMCYGVITILICYAVDRFSRTDGWDPE